MAVKFQQNIFSIWISTNLYFFHRQKICLKWRVLEKKLHNLRNVNKKRHLSINWIPTKNLCVYRSVENTSWGLDGRICSIRHYGSRTCHKRLNYYLQRINIYNNKSKYIQYSWENLFCRYIEAGDFLNRCILTCYTFLFSGNIIKGNRTIIDLFSIGTSCLFENIWATAIPYASTAIIPPKHVHANRKVFH